MKVLVIALLVLGDVSESVMTAVSQAVVTVTRRDMAG